MKKMLATFAILSAVVITGCNTFKGVGEDVSKAGDKVSQAATDTQKKL
ncbi:MULTISPECIES: entericidin A/B family lipoprotein [Acinetobacter]|jgi:predicted small secreted protein|uniref:Entericidin n=2 Tax=Acinetobacter TaxID=469 RepID=A0A1Z9YV43_9GAMM|nr:MULTISPECIES: entericidin A/B family lipoprotein [Acinetobacter]MCH4248976.1 entericidin A/B family lipoprotein [Acinetobacter populi]OUY06071.1 entericidin [Acinetobacter populi]SNX44877.1 Predicted small secreted protein [Acinetobacter puyangensis]